MTVTSEPCQPGTPLYNSRIIASYVRMVERFYPHVDFNGLLPYAKMEPYQVEDEDYWFSQEQVDLFYERMVSLTKNKNIAREAGRYACSEDSLGIMKSYALGFINPTMLCKMIGKAVGHFAKSCVWEATETAPNTVQITVKPRPGTEEKPYQCENRMGYIESLSTLFKHKLPTIEHPECVFNGAPSCQYVVSWRNFRSDVWRKTRNYLAVVLPILCIVAYLFFEPNVWIGSIPISLAVLFILSSKVWNMEKEELFSAIRNLRTSSDTLFDKISDSQHNANLIHEVGITLTRQTRIEGILKDVAQVLQKSLNYDRGMILLADKERTILRFETGFGYTEEDVPKLRRVSFRLRPESKGVLVECFRRQKPFLVNNLEEIEYSLSLHSLDFARKMGAKSFICCPITCSNDSIGVLAVDNVRTKRTLLQSDIDLLMLLTPEIGMSLQNAIVTDTKERQFNSILEVLASSIDARDPLTAGHSERVTRFATGICAELGLSEEYREMIRVASLLHDYGKIAIKDSILKKPGALTSEEYEEIKTHATKTKEILEKIEFEGIYIEVPEIASCHHEKWDGTGYPNHLKFEEIPLGARILAVADVFEAITSKRHYRGPMPLEEAFALLESNKSSHFDPAIVDAFVRYYQGEGQSLDSPKIELNVEVGLQGRTKATVVKGTTSRRRASAG